VAQRVEEGGRTVMESPASWTRARNAIFRGIKRAQEERLAHKVGHSDAALIEAELLKGGFLTPESQEVVGWQGEPTGTLAVAEPSPVRPPSL